jgi:phenylacetate-CoA ligase
MERQGMTAQDCSLRIGIFGDEPWTPAMRRGIEERVGLEATDIYGLTELMGPGVAQEFLETKDGLTVWEDFFLPEIIDPVTGEVVADGQQGEMVFTSLAKEGLPMIRYRTRDLTKLLPGSACTMRRIDTITGRSDDMLIIRGVNVFPTQIEELICKSPKLAPHYIIEVYREGNMDSVDVLVEPRSGVTFEEQEAAAKQLQHDIKTFIGISTRIKPVDIGAIVRSEGKAKRVIDKRPKE